MRVVLPEPVNAVGDVLLIFPSPHKGLERALEPIAATPADPEAERFPEA